MIKLNRTTEYGLMALRHMSRKQADELGAVTSAREIADSYGLPFEITAKTLQRLKDLGFVQSAQGSKGGYTLQRSLESISLAEFLELMEGCPKVVACSGPTGTKASEVPGNHCEYEGKCELKGVMSHLNRRVFDFLSGICLAELTDERGPAI